MLNVAHASMFIKNKDNMVFIWISFKNSVNVFISALRYQRAGDEDFCIDLKHH